MDHGDDDACNSSSWHVQIIYVLGPELTQPAYIAIENIRNEEGMKMI